MSNSWWASKLGGQPAPAAPQTPPTALPPVYPPVATPPYTPQYTQPVPAPQVLPASATAARCPNCSSGNYVGTVETKKRCYDCGYPVQQSGSGTPGVRIPGAQGGAVQATKQVSTQNNFNPNVIVDRIG